MLEAELKADQGRALIRLVDHKPPAEVSAAPSWPDIEGALLEEKDSVVPAFPNDALPPPWCAWIADSARSVNVPADYVAQAVLAAVAGVCGAGIWVRVSSVWVEHLSLWLAVVGAPSSGKSPAIDAVHGLLRALEREGTGTPVEAIDPDAPESPKRRPSRIIGSGNLDAVVGVATENQRGVILWRDEPEGCFAPLVSGTAVRKLDPFPVTILGALEPDRLTVTVQRGEATLAARFLYAWPAPPPFQPLAERTPARDDEVLALLRAIRNRAGTMRDPLYLGIDADGLLALDGFLAGLHADLRHAEGLEAAWLGKGRGVVPRLATVLHLLDWSVAQSADPSVALGPIGRDSMERAIALWSSYYRPHAKAFFDRMAPSDLESRVRRVVRWLKTYGLDEISREDVRRTALGQTVNASEADRVLARLTEAGVLRQIASGSGPKGGRPALRWEVNPALRTA
jgi:hypothetical protein